MTNYNNVVEAGSESDDEDKLHIVEEEGGRLADGADCDSTLPDEEHPRERCWDRGETRRELLPLLLSGMNHAKTHTRTFRQPTSQCSVPCSTFFVLQKKK